MFLNINAVFNIIGKIQSMGQRAWSVYLTENNTMYKNMHKI